MDVREVSAEDVEVQYVSAADIREGGALGRLRPVRFESVRPERRFPAFRIRATGVVGTGRRPVVGMWL